jgi:hypothetical protein
MPSLEVFMVGSLDAAALVGIFFLLADQICVESAPLAVQDFVYPELSCLQLTALRGIHRSANRAGSSCPWRSGEQ